MSEQIKKSLKDELFYLEKVELTFRGLDKELLDCMSKLCNHLLVSCTFNSVEATKCINLLNFLNSQHKSCEAFIKDYGVMTEDV